MRAIKPVLALILCLCRPAEAQDGIGQADGAAIRQVISAQIEAFRHDDGTTALGFAAPNIRAKFNDGSHFLDMVRTGYLAVLRPRSVSFGALTDTDGKPVQEVELVGPSGDAALALYSMEHEADGSWKISGCALVHSKRLDI